MVARRKSVKKTRSNFLRLPSGQKVAMTRGTDAEELSKRYSSWKREADRHTGDKIGMSNEMSLLSMIEKHGIDGRVQGGSVKSTGDGMGSNYIKVLDKLASPGRVLDKRNIDVLDKMVELMDSIEKAKSSSKLNPRNIAFKDPLKYNKQGVTTLPDDVYGHFLTPRYVKRINQKAKANDGEFKGKLWDKPGHDSWYSGSMGTAEPPMWQALYGNGGHTPFEGESLMSIVKEMSAIYKKALEKDGVDIPKSAPIQIGQRGGWQKALDLSEIREMVENMVTNIQSQKRQSRFVSRSGALHWSNVKSDIEGSPIDITNANDNTTAKELANMAEEGEIKLNEVWVTVPRKQINQMVHAVAQEKGLDSNLGSGNDTLYLFASKKVERVREETAQKAKETSGEKPVKKSWEAILVC